jgi:hypothetical protein
MKPPVANFLLVAFLALSLSAQAASGPDRLSSTASRSGLSADFYRAFTHDFVEANGVRLHYVVGGPADGDMAVLLHGWPQTWYTWR